MGLGSAGIDASPFHTRWTSEREAEAHAQALQESLNTQMARVWAFAAACPVERWWGGRSMILFDGALEAVSSIGRPTTGESGVARQCPQWWWPADRAWFVGTDIDHPWTYVAGSRLLVDRVLDAPHWESVAVESTDRW